MGKSLEARVAKLEAGQADETYGLVRARQLAELAGYTDAELDDKTRFFAWQPYRTHEQWVEWLLAT